MINARTPQTITTIGMPIPSPIIAPLDRLFGDGLDVGVADEVEEVEKIDEVPEMEVMEVEVGVDMVE